METGNLNCKSTNMCHIHASIVSRHLATRSNNKIPRTPPPHISSSEERLPPIHLSHPCPTQNKQISLPQIILTQSRRQITFITTMSPLQHPHTPSHLFNCTHIHTTLSPLDLWTNPTGVMELLARRRYIRVDGQKVG